MIIAFKPRIIANGRTKCMACGLMSSYLCNIQIWCRCK